MTHVIATPDQIGPLLAAARRLAGLTQDETAARTGLSQSRLSTLEADASSLTVTQLLALCGVYDLQFQLREKNPTSQPDQPAAPDTPASGPVEW